jgi:asparagine synthetase B (glutamine-hydrolysing)
MCGIFAAMTRRGLSSERCDAALKLLEHRGPDGSGIWTSRDGQWTLGHTRLSIIGLNNGSQPMSSPDGAVHLVVNGEFYGYREIRERLRESEIAVHLYQERGMQAATLLRGEMAMFASIRIGIGRFRLLSRCGQIRDATPRSSKSSARLWAMPCGSDWSPMSRSRRI